MTMKGEKRLQDSELYESCHHFQERRSNARFFFATLIVLWAFAFALNCWHSAFGGVQVSGPSMLNTLQDGEYLLMKYYNEGDDLPYGSVIILDIAHYPEVQEYNQGKPAASQTRYLVKRLIAKEGDKVRCSAGVLEICYSGTDEYVVLDEPYAKYTNKSAYSFTQEYVVGEGEIFFLGDNRNVSMDSRYNENMSHLDRLYKESDIYGIVPDWAIEHQEALEKIFFWRDVLANKQKS